MENITYPITGTCQCGSVQYSLKKEPLKIVACHCRECQKLSTSAFSLSAIVIVNESDVDIVGVLGDWSRVSNNGNVVTAIFCPKCSNRIYHYNPSFPEQIKLKLSNVSTMQVLHPTHHIWVSEKQPWFDIPNNVEIFEKQP